MLPLPENIKNLSKKEKKMIQRPPFKVFAGTNTRYLAEKICNSLGCELGKMNIQHFADGEFSVSFEESIRGCQVFLIQSTYPNADNLMELLLMIDAAKRASADSIIAVTPYFGWARQDRKDKPRVSIAAKLIADLLSVAGIDRLITMDLHADQIQGFFNVPPLRIDRLRRIHQITQTQRHGYRITRCRRFKTSKLVCQVFRCALGIMS